ncbi:hypothetical protein O0I10_008680 [Lichtheimia ornata]|uniref:Uncharacterized protein n=1 Tax=Lichtheimia ornata TaxID=688661 RepID=A0AAD7UZQ4_9FUNG|nr:uncharacterized protein O0I10_008680 [Lichtheimia ornata]KAJ8655592.1 hypothetical protein O0I10_008680 [Lichtheimia ornata]
MLLKMMGLLAITGEGPGLSAQSNTCTIPALSLFEPDTIKALAFHCDPTFIVIVPFGSFVIEQPPDMRLQHWIKWQSLLQPER